MRELFISALITVAALVALVAGACVLFLWPVTTLAVMTFGFLFMLVHSERTS